MYRFFFRSEQKSISWTTDDHPSDYFSYSFHFLSLFPSTVSREHENVVPHIQDHYRFLQLCSRATGLDGISDAYGCCTLLLCSCLRIWRITYSSGKSVELTAKKFLTPRTSKLEHQIFLSALARLLNGMRRKTCWAELIYTHVK